MMNAKQEGSVSKATVSELLGLLEEIRQAIRRARAGYPGASLTTEDILHSLAIRVPDLATKESPAGFAHTYTKRRLTERVRWHEVRDRAAATGEQGAVGVSDGQRWQAAAGSQEHMPALLDARADVAAILHAIDLLERDEAPPLPMRDKEGKLIRWKVTNQKHVARVLRGVYFEPTSQQELADELGLKEEVISKLKMKGLRYLALVATRTGLGGAYVG